MNVTPVLLLTGYLGSGKTTLLNRILNNRQGIRFAVIVNDIGEVNIDAGLIAKGGMVNEQADSLVPLQNGCICCTLKMDLVQQLSDLVNLARFDYIVIEASGICEPAPIAQSIQTYPHLYPNLATQGIARLDAIVTVVDALRLRDEFAGGDALQQVLPKEEDLASLVIQQIEFCNLILLNKASEVSPSELAHIQAIIREIQPKAAIIPCDYCEVDLDRIVGTRLFDFEQVATSARWISEIEGDATEDAHAHEHHHGHHDEGHRHHDEEHEGHHPHEHHCHHCHHGLENEEEGEALEYGIGTFVYQRREAFSMVEFDQLVARLWPRNVIRCKGVCYFDTEPDICYVFEQAGRQFSLGQAGQWYACMPEDELEAFMQQNPSILRDWDEHYGDRMQKLVFIGQNMDKETITALLDACLSKKKNA